jgi:hypothetical protein
LVTGGSQAAVRGHFELHKNRSGIGRILIAILYRLVWYTAYENSCTVYGFLAARIPGLGFLEISSKQFLQGIPVLYYNAAVIFL